MEKNLDRKYNIVLATGIEELDDMLTNLKNSNILEKVDDKNSLETIIKKTNPHILILSEHLKGDFNLITLACNLKRLNRYLRIIYLAGDLNLRDEERMRELGRLVLYGIYDIYISDNINLEILNDMIQNPKKQEQVSYLAKNLISNDNDLAIDLGLSTVNSDILNNVYVFTSIKPGTGKSFLSVNTACAIAKYGLKEDGTKPKVALIEADMQTLSIGTILNEEYNQRKNLKVVMEAISNIFDRGNIIANEEERFYADRIIKNSLIETKLLSNLSILNGSELTPEEINALNICPEYYTYLIDVLSKEYDIVIIDTNSSIFHVTTYPLLQKAKECFYILNLDYNNIKNNHRYIKTLKSLGIYDKIKYILNESIISTNSKDSGTNLEKLTYNIDDLESKGLKIALEIPLIPKSVFLNRLYNGTPVVLDENKSYTRDIKNKLLDLASFIINIERDDKKVETKSRKKFLGIF